MADEGLIRAGALALGLLVAGCGGENPGVQTATVPHAVEPPARPYPESESQWGAFHSLRYRMTVPLPSARAWTIDDHSHPELLATEASTHSTLTVTIETERTLVNHQRCEERARETASAMKLFPEGRLQTIEDVVTVGPDAYDTRVLVAIERGAGKKLVGHVLAFGAYVTKCFLFHLATEVASEDDEQALSQRLALGRVRTLGGIKLEELAQPPKPK